MARALTWLLGALAVAGALPLLGGYLGALHPAGDSLAVFRLWLALGVGLSALLLALLGARRLGAGLLALALVAAVPLALRMAPGQARAGPGDGQSLYQKNLLFLLPDPAPILSEIGALRPDHITLQEVSARNRAAVFEALPEAYARHICPFARVGAVAVASRHPVDPGSEICHEGSGLAAFRVTSPDGPLWVVSIHLHWPWPHGQAGQVDRLLPLLAALDGPVLIGGDFNMVPWSHTLRRIERAARARVQGPTRGTRPLLAPLVDLPIDHVLFPGRGGLQYRPPLGSDHDGVLARFHLDPGA